jgi:hypothetical protein
MKKIQHFGIESGNARAMFLVQILQHDIGDRGISSLCSRSGGITIWNTLNR